MSLPFQLVVGLMSYCQLSSELIDRTVFILRIHHAYTDAIHLLNNFIFRFASDPFVTKIPSPPKRTFAENSSIFLKIICSFPYIIQMVFFWKKSYLNSTKLSGDKIIAISENIPLAFIEKIRRKYTVSFTTVLLSVIGDALNGYISEAKLDSVNSVNSFYLVPTEGPKRENKSILNALTCRFSFIPTVKMTPENRLIQTSLELTAKMKTMDMYIIEWLTYFCNKIPQFAFKFIALKSPTAIILSNVPGPVIPPLVNDEKVDSVMFWAPNKGNTGITFSVLSMNGHMKIGLQVDKKLIPNRLLAERFLNTVVKNLEYLSSTV